MEVLSIHRCPTIYSHIYALLDYLDGDDDDDEDQLVLHGAVLLVTVGVCSR